MIECKCSSREKRGKILCRKNRAVHWYMPVKDSLFYFYVSTKKRACLGSLCKKRMQNKALLCPFA